jgi:mono/diheme cytochrome c family protein
MALGLAVLLPAHAGGQPAKPWVKDANASFGQNQTPAAIYHNYCSVCHGDKGDGESRAKGSMNPAPRDFTTTQALKELTRDRMIAAVKAGVPGTAMVGWDKQLTEQQIIGVVDYVRDNFMRASLAADASRGRQIYARSCSVCHGDRGQGSMWASANLTPPPRDFSSPQARAELDRDRMIAAVAAGRPGTAMAGFANQLNAEEMAAVVDYIRGSFMRVDAEKGISGTHAHGAPATPPQAAATPPAPVKLDMTLPLPVAAKPDVAWGKKFYNDNCATCHGEKGDGQGPRAYFINPKPAIFTEPRMRAMLNRPAIYAAVAAGKRGTEMPAWDKVLTPQEMASVSEYVFVSFIQPKSKQSANATKRP